MSQIKKFSVFFILTVLISSVAFAGKASLDEQMMKAQENLAAVVNNPKADLNMVESALQNVETVMQSISELDSDKKDAKRLEYGILIGGSATAVVLFARSFFITMGEGLGDGLAFIFTAPISILLKQEPVLPKRPSFWKRSSTLWFYGAAGVTVVAYAFARNSRKELEKTLKKEMDQAKEMFENSCKVYDLLARKSTNDLVKTMPRMTSFCMNLERVLNEKP